MINEILNGNSPVNYNLSLDGSLNYLAIFQVWSHFAFRSFSIARSLRFRAKEESRLLQMCAMFIEIWIKTS